MLTGHSELNRIIASRHGFDVPIDVLVFLNASYVVKINLCKEVEKDGHTADEQALDTPICHMTVRHDARRLDEQEGLTHAVTAWVECWDIAHEIFDQLIDPQIAILPSMALLFHELLEIVIV